jgi:hypothetical protein
MKAAEVTEELEQLAGGDDDDIVPRARELTERWTLAGVGIEAAEPVLRFMESHPSIDFGSPGPLVHFVERLDRPAYVQCLIASLARKPTSLTAWMLNRAINAATDATTRRALVETMQLACRHPAADAGALVAINGFLHYQRKGEG